MTQNITQKYQQFEQDDKMVFVINEGEAVKAFAIPKSWGQGTIDKLDDSLLKMILRGEKKYNAGENWFQDFAILIDGNMFYTIEDMADYYRN